MCGHLVEVTAGGPPGTQALTARGGQRAGGPEGGAEVQIQRGVFNHIPPRQHSSTTNTFYQHLALLIHLSSPVPIPHYVPGGSTPTSSRGQAADSNNNHNPSPSSSHLEKLWLASQGKQHHTFPINIYTIINAEHTLIVNADTFINAFCSHNLSAPH